MNVYFGVLKADDTLYLLERHEVTFLKVTYTRNVDVCFEFLSGKQTFLHPEMSMTDH